MPGKHIAFVFSDPAGANACIALSRLYSLETGHKPLLFSNRKHFSGEVENFQQTDTVPDFEGLGIDCVFTGTSHPSSSDQFEVKCIREARRKNIHTISFVDHWVNFSLRFEGLKSGERPDEIWVVDEEAMKRAKKEGLEESRLKIHDNPYHTYLQMLWQPAYGNKEYFDKLGIPKTGYHILFAPDPLSLRNGKEMAGFTEAEAFHDLKYALSAIGGDVHLVIKCHPLQPTEVFKPLDNQQGIYLLKDVDVLELIGASDLVIGFYSNLLLEAEAMGKNVLRYFPGHPGADLLKHKKSIKLVTNQNDLEKELKHCING